MSPYHTPISRNFGIKSRIQPLPTGSIVFLQESTFQGKTSRTIKHGRFEHESHGLVEILRLQIGLDSVLESLGLRPVREHAVMQAAATRLKAAGWFCIIHPINQPHIFTHHIAMEIGRAE